MYNDLPWITMMYHDLPGFTMNYHVLPWFIMIYHDLLWLTRIYHDFPSISMFFSSYVNNNQRGSRWLGNWHCQGQSLEPDFGDVLGVKLPWCKPFKFIYNPYIYIIIYIWYIYIYIFVSVCTMYTCLYFHTSTYYIIYWSMIKWKVNGFGWLDMHKNLRRFEVSKLWPFEWKF